jgi:hypothetical protein
MDKRVEAIAAQFAFASALGAGTHRAAQAIIAADPLTAVARQMHSALLLMRHCTVHHACRNDEENPHETIIKAIAAYDALDKGPGE